MNKKPKFKRGQVVNVLGFIKPYGYAVILYRDKLMRDEYYWVRRIADETCRERSIPADELRPLTKKEKGE